MANNIDLMIEQLSATVQAVKDVSDRASSFILSVPDRIAAAVEEARQAGATEAQLSAINDQLTVLTAEANELANDLNVVDPAPVPEPEPEPTPEPTPEG